jgi:hypothetical protein
MQGNTKVTKIVRRTKPDDFRDYFTTTSDGAQFKGKKRSKSKYTKALKVVEDATNYTLPTSQSATQSDTI